MHRLVTMHTHGDFIVLPHWETRVTRYPTQSHHPVTKPTSPCPLLIMPSPRLGSDKYQFLRHWFDLTSVRIRVFESHDLLNREMDAQLIQPAHLVKREGEFYVLYIFT